MADLSELEIDRFRKQAGIEDWATERRNTSLRDVFVNFARLVRKELVEENERFRKSIIRSANLELDLIRFIDGEEPIDDFEQIQNLARLFRRKDDKPLLNYVPLSYNDKKRLFNTFYDGQANGREMVSEVEKEVLRRINDCIPTELPTFEEVWAEKEAQGYRYGEDALEQVKFGFELARRS